MTIIEQHVEQLMRIKHIQPNPLFVTHTRTVVLLHAAQVFPPAHSIWTKLIAPLTISIVALASIALIIFFRMSADQRELNALQQEIHSIQISDEHFL